jgi:hypothetical protein
MSCLKLDADGDVIAMETQGRITNEQFVMSLRDAWSSDYRQSAFLRDIPRLIKRTQIQTSNYEIKGPFTEDDKVEAILKTLEIICEDTNFDQHRLEIIRGELSKLTNSLILLLLSLNS